MRKLKSAVLATVCSVALSPLAAMGQQPIYYPAKGQLKQQQDRDAKECRTWAQGHTGINPATLKPPTGQEGPSGPAVGGGERAKGAVRGAVIGGIAGGHAGEGAAAGAVVGGARARRNQAAEQQQAQQQASSDYSSKINTYNRAVGACMEGRGYTVK